MVQAAGELNNFIERMQTADNAIEQARGEMSVHMSALGELFTSGPWDEAAEEPSIDDALTALDSAADNAAGLLESRFGAALTGMQDMLQEHARALTDACAAWTETQVTTGESVQSLQTALTEAARRVTEAFDALGSDYDAAAEALATAQAAVDEALQACSNAVSDEFTDAFDVQMKAFTDDLANEQTARIRDNLSLFQRTGEEILRHLTETSDQLLDQFSQQLDGALNDLMQHVGEQLTQEMERAAREIVESAVREMSYAIMEAIAASQVGVAVTSAMAPILPELIAAKKVTDAILEAIRIWKETVGRLNSFF